MHMSTPRNEYDGGRAFGSGSVLDTYKIEGIQEGKKPGVFSLELT